MAMLDLVYAATVNPNLKKSERHKPRVAEDFMPFDFARERRKSKRISKEQLLEKLDRYAGIK